MEIEVKIRALMMDPNSGSPIIILKDIKSENRAIKLLRKFHGPECFAISFRLGHAEISISPLFRITTLLMSYNNHRNSMEKAVSANNS